MTDYLFTQRMNLNKLYRLTNVKYLMQVTTIASIHLILIIIHIYQSFTCNYTLLLQVTLVNLLMGALVRGPGLHTIVTESDSDLLLFVQMTIGLYHPISTR